MSDVVLSEPFFAKAAGWEAMKTARAYLAMDKVLSSNWTAPLLKGVVQDGTLSFRAGLVIKGETNIENICTCRSSREWGTICGHSVAVGLHHLRRSAPPLEEKKTPSAAPAPATRSPNRDAKRLQRAGSGETGEALELRLILPPNLGEAVQKGKILLVLEGHWRGGRGPLNGLPRHVSFTLDKADVAILDRAELLAGGDTPGMLLLGRKDFLEFLPLLAGRDGITLGKNTELEIASEPWAPPLRASLEADGEIKLTLSGAVKLPVLFTEGEGSATRTWALSGNRLQPAAVSGRLAALTRGPVRIPRTEVPQFLNAEWAQLAAAPGFAADFDVADFELAPQPPQFLLHLSGGIAQLQGHLQCAYGTRIMTIGVSSGSEMVWLPDPANPKRYSTRDTSAERGALQRLLKAGFTGPDGQGRLQMVGQNQVLSFFARDYTRLQKEWKVTLEERLERSTENNLERLEPRFEITSSGVQWFDLSVNYSTGSGQQFSAAEIQRLILSGQNHTRLRNGKFAIIDTGAMEELQEVLLDASPQQHGGGYRVSNAQAGFIESSLQAQGWTARAPEAWTERARQQSGAVALECPPLGDLETVLRPYQKTGVAWMHFLRANRFGGILADEMGLGKTLQTLAFLRDLPRAKSGETAPHLIVCPTSLVHNWVAEARKFTPTLRVLALHGPDRHKLFDQVPTADLVVTSYALIRRDAEKHRGTEFDTVVLDEAQHIKNRETQNAQAVKSIRSQHRLVLTGTPLENSVLDLWSIFDFLMPGYLGTAKDFRERYELPIVREKSAAAQTRLARRLRPFILRRLKRDVVKDLPDKIEQVSFCELNEEQRGVYQQVLEASRREIDQAAGPAGLAKSRMVVLTALLRLRQVCCDLRLLKLEEKKAGTSGKLELFRELLEEIMDGGHRVLVFSQFVSMLTLLREELDAGKIPYCYLDGSTQNRAEVVERFQKQEEVPVFLISLKAGGVGLNLTGADTVIHFDPWWNPAVEQQATDRAHRIGQKRVVTSYKLITRGTVEEKILELQNRKRGLISGTLEGEEAFTETLNWEEIQELLG